MIKSIRVFSLFAFVICSTFFFAQAQNPGKDEEAAKLLQKVTEKYKAYKNISANFKLLIQRPKLKVEDDDRKYVDTLTGQILLQGAKFKVSVKERQIFCDGKTIWTYVPEEKEVEVNLFEETDDVFSPSKIFTLYKEGNLYQIKEKKVVNGKKTTVIEMAVPNKKLSYFKVDISIDDASLEIIESKVYEKNGTRYIYKITKQANSTSVPDDAFVFDPKKHPGVKVVDLK